MNIYNFFKNKVEAEEEVQFEETVINPDGFYRIDHGSNLDGFYRIDYGSFYTWGSTENFTTTAVWDYLYKNPKVPPPNNSAIGIIDTDDTYCIDPDTGKQFFIFVPKREVEYKSIRAFDIKDILIELDRQKSVIEEKRNKRYRDDRVRFLEDINSNIKVDLCNKSVNDE